MNFTKIEITADLAHFKKPLHSKKQLTYEVPPISTVVGILQNLYGEDIDDFVFGYTFEHEDIFRDIHTIYKEINRNSYKLTNYEKRFQTDICEVQYLINPKLIIYTDINKEKVVSEVLNLGKTDCLAKIVRETNINLIQKESIGYNQYTAKNVGTGIIERITTETRFNDNKGYFDIFTDLVRLNREFEYNDHYDEEEQQNIFLWKWRKDGAISEFNQKEANI